MVFRRYASTIPPAGPPPSGGSNTSGLLLGAGAVAAIAGYFYYANNQKSVDSQIRRADNKAHELKGRAKADLEDAQQRAAKALK
ncbi:hypothetical protein B9479_005877 [Cryptococcus floricola]|uniref:Uncharacterized protein n=1 Tax=Cryptococcus floricola TaxID=2591691 RepID=A0A5D3ATF2_9TREE|nr:hypothetical protein B9479_005877 [Cryptococcus floricola]